MQLAVVLFAQETSLLLGDDLLAWIVLAFGAAMAAGNALALLRPPEEAEEGDLERAPTARSIVMIVIGSLAALWALGSMLAA